LKGDKSFTTHTLTHAVGILPRQKLVQNDKERE